jgi:transglutaminase-like putative cysteine protease
MVLRLTLIFLMGSILIASGQAHILANQENPQSSSENLLQNPGFEDDTNGDDIPDFWERVPTPAPPGVEFIWDDAVYHNGTYSVSIESISDEIAMWRQMVPVSGDTMYTFAGWIKTENVDPGEAKLQLVFRDSDNNVLSFFELDRHFKTREWIYDNPHEVTVLSPSTAVKVEVNCFLRGVGRVWFDDLYFGLTHTGTIAGTVTSEGAPLPGVYVYVFGTSYSAITDADGKYIITDVPVASPRYIVIANKTGYIDGQQGDVNVIKGGTTIVNFDLKRGGDRGELIVRGATLRKREESPVLDIPSNAVIDPDLYPEYVKIYLKPGRGIESDDPSIVEVANQILNSVAPENRTNLLEVAHAVYLWFGDNIDYDVISRYPYDVTCGNWQTNFGGWGHNFSDWLYTAVETLDEKRAICIEYARLSSAILRALNISARPAPYMGHPGTQFWVQLPTGDGYWAIMDTSIGSTAYRQAGDEWFAFPAVPEDVIGFWPIDENAPIHVDWYTKNKCLWRESYGGSRNYPDTTEGYNDAVAGLQYFAEHGVVPSGPSEPSAPCYSLEARGSVIDLTCIGDQTTLWFRFPLAIETEYVHTINATYWTNHPEWVTRTWIENVTNPPVPDTFRWLYVEFDLSRAHDVAITEINVYEGANKTMMVNVTVENQGSFTETFNISVFYTRISDPLIGTQNVTLPSAANVTLSFEWRPNMTGRYEIRAEADVVPGELDTTDNIRIITVYVGYGGSSLGSHNTESLNGYHVVVLILPLFTPVMILSFRKNREISLVDIPATALKQSLNNNPPAHHANTWRDWIKRQII